MTMLISENFAAAPAASHQKAAGTRLSGAVQGAPLALLRAEGAVVFAASLIAYVQLGGGWGLFAALFLLPDLALLAYLAGPRAGAVAYNAAHSYLGPALLALASMWSPALLPVAAIWLGHVGFDRMLGYGLKYGEAFRDTHLGRIGKR